MIAKRLIKDELFRDLRKREITILLGARQVGKTHLLKEIKRRSELLGKKTAYYNLEIPCDLLEFKGSEREIFEKLASQSDVLLIDEFHYLKNASHLFKAIYDSGAKVKIFASGSSSLEIHKHLKESLAGRRRLRKIYPLSLAEYKINRLPLTKVLVEGTLPGLLHLRTSRDKQSYLRDLLETYIMKDIKSLIKEENIRAFNHLLSLLAEYQGSIISVANLAAEVGLTIPTIEKYLSILEATYVCYSISSFSTNLANELKKSRKYYFYDLGMRNALMKNFEYELDRRRDKGVLYESIVFLELQKNTLPNTSLHFWRTKQKNEVDFIKLVNRQPIPIEVKSNLRELSLPPGLKCFLDKYPSARKAYVVNAALTGKIRYKKTQVEFLLWSDADRI